MIRIENTQMGITILDGQGVVTKDKRTASLTGRETVVSAKGKALV